MNSAVGRFVKFAVEGSASDSARAEADELWNSLSSSERKQATESRAFISFAKATQLVKDPFQHTNEDPPLPDICISINDVKWYFELGEITDEGLAESMGISQKTRMAAGCAVSRTDPHMKMLVKKCSKMYPTNGAPVDLLLYYWRHPDEAIMYDHLREHRLDIEKLHQSSQYNKVWIYNWQSRRVLWKIEGPTNLV